VVPVFAFQVTVKLVEEYIKPEEMVILCVIPAMSDFGNAEVWFSFEYEHACW
jgi:hypothetical protein